MLLVAAAAIFFLLSSISFFEYNCSAGAVESLMENAGPPPIGIAVLALRYYGMLWHYFRAKKKNVFNGRKETRGDAQKETK